MVGTPGISRQGQASSSHRSLRGGCDSTQTSGRGELIQKRSASVHEDCAPGSACSQDLSDTAAVDDTRSPCRPIGSHEHPRRVPVPRRWCEYMVSGCVSSPWRHTKWVQIDPFTTVAALTACLAAVVPPGSRLYIEYHGMLLGPHDLEDEDLPAVGSLRAMAVPPAGVSCDSMDWKYLERMEWMQRSDEAQGSDGDAAVSASHESTAGPADGSDEGGRSGSGGGSSGGGSGGGRGGGSRGGGSGSTTAGGVDDEVTVKRPSSAAGSGSDSERSIESINTWHRNLKQHSSSGARYL